MKFSLFILFSIVFGFFLQEPSCRQDTGGGSQCPTPFYPPYNVRSRVDLYRGGIIIEWDDRGYKDGYQVFRCSNNCAYQGQDGLLHANLGNFQAITNNKFAGTSLLDKNLSPRVTYYYAVQNRYQSCGVNWSSNFTSIVAP